MGLENALNNLTDELKRRRKAEGVDTSGMVVMAIADSDESSHDDDHHDDYEHDPDDHDCHDDHDDCTDADGDGYCDSSDDD